MYVFGTLAFTPHKLVLCVAQPGNNAKTFVGPSCTDVDVETVLKVGDLSWTIAMTAHCFGALSQVRAIGHCVIDQERDLLKPDWLNWWVCP